MKLQEQCFKALVKTEGIYIHETIETSKYMRNMKASYKVGEDIEDLKEYIVLKGTNLMLLL